jgi:hypothetical protein
MPENNNIFKNQEKLVEHKSAFQAVQSPVPLKKKKVILRMKRKFDLRLSLK